VISSDASPGPLKAKALFIDPLANIYGPYHGQQYRGECEGFNGDRVFELVNGQKWQQAVYRYKYRYRYRPSVRIWRDARGDYIEIEGMDELVRVRRV
jgi:hypothetical protein